MVRLTSRDAYAELMASGSLKGQYAELQKLIVEHDGGTAAEILKGSPFAKNKNAAMARFTELRERGLIVEGPIRECAVTGRQCLTWEATSRTKPLALKRGKGKATKAQLLKIAQGLAKYAVHDNCASEHGAEEDGEETPCDCGLDDAQADLKAVTG